MGWPGRLYGCGRPFQFPITLRAGPPTRGLFLTWDDKHTAESVHELVKHDPDGDYTRVTHEDIKASGIDAAKVANFANVTEVVHQSDGDMKETEHVENDAK